MNIHGWGRYPHCEAQILLPADEEQVVRGLAAGGGDIIARGLGRSYGDASLAGRVMNTRRLDNLISFDESNGILGCGAGVSLAQLTDCFLPRGWLPRVLPGTRFVTIGGAIASDVHGKNHHTDGSFCDHVRSINVATVSEGIVHCSRQRHPALFHATCGGMGLTGVIVSAQLQLRRINSGYIDESVHCAENLDAALALFDAHRNAAYSVAWIDCAARGASLGRSVVRLGEHSSSGGFGTAQGRQMPMPFDLPGGVVNRHTVRIFNHFYYAAARRGAQKRRVPLLSWFFPLDSIGNWNRIYGRRGFLQYQCVLPSGREDGLRDILQRIAHSPHGSFLAVLKQLGEGGDNPLGFPRAGYTLALDFARAKGIGDFLDGLDDIVLRCGGRLYLTKDARMSAAAFRACYPKWREFCDVRRHYGAERMIHSLMSRRLEIR